jgi:NADH dehydrogenase
MAGGQTHVVTGALGYSGRYIATRLIERGHRVVTLSNSAVRADKTVPDIEIRPFNFEDPDKLTESLRGVSVLYNTYWVRFNHKLFKHADAVKNTLTLFESARKAGVERVVHISITNPSPDSHLEYFREKAHLEEALKGTGVSYAILRPAVIFGKEDILINNIAWFIRRFPVFGVFGDGNYRLQPIYVEDLAKLVVEHGELRDNVVIDAIGPETFTYRGLVDEIGGILGKKRIVISISPAVGYLVARAAGMLVGDVIITREEIEGLMENRLYVNSPPAGTTRLTEWAARNADYLGRHYHSELARRRRRQRE